MQSHALKGETCLCSFSWSLLVSVDLCFTLSPTYHYFIFGWDKNEPFLSYFLEVLKFGWYFLQIEKEEYRNTKKVGFTLVELHYKTTITEYGRMLMSEAMELSLWYDLIIVLEWLRDEPTYARKIEDVVFNGVWGLSVLGTIQPQFCHKQSKLADQKQPWHILNSILQRVSIKGMTSI